MNIHQVLPASRPLSGGETVYLLMVPTGEIRKAENEAFRL